MAAAGSRKKFANSNLNTLLGVPKEAAKANYGPAVRSGGVVKPVAKPKGLVSLGKAPATSSVNARKGAAWNQLEEEAKKRAEEESAKKKDDTRPNWAVLDFQDLDKPLAKEDEDDEDRTELDDIHDVREDGWFSAAAPDEPPVGDHLVDLTPEDGGSGLGGFRHLDSTVEGHAIFEGDEEHVLESVALEAKDGSSWADHTEPSEEEIPTNELAVTPSEGAWNELEEETEAQAEETSAKKAEDTRPDWRTAFIHMVNLDKPLAKEDRDDEDRTELDDIHDVKEDWADHTEPSEEEAPTNELGVLDLMVPRTALVINVSHVLKRLNGCCSLNQLTKALKSFKEKAGVPLEAFLRSNPRTFKLEGRIVYLVDRDGKNWQPPKKDASAVGGTDAGNLERGKGQAKGKEAKGRSAGEGRRGKANMKGDLPLAKGDGGAGKGKGGKGRAHNDEWSSWTSNGNWAPAWNEWQAEPDWKSLHRKASRWKAS